MHPDRPQSGNHTPRNPGSPQTPRGRGQRRRGSQGWGKVSARGPRERGAAAGVSAGRVHACCPGTSHASVPAAPGHPEPAFALSSNLKHSPGNLKGSTPVQEPRQGLRAAVGCQAAVSGAAGLAGGCQLCLVFPFLPWTLRRPSRRGGARVLGQAQRPYSGAGGEPRTGHMCSRHTRAPRHVRPALLLPPRARAPACPPTACSRGPVAPRCQPLLPNPHRRVGPGESTEPLDGEGGDAFPEPRVTGRSTHAHASPPPTCNVSRATSEPGAEPPGSPA